MYWSACISTCASRSPARSARGIWITLVIAASPEMATATSLALGAGALDGAADRLADRFRVDDRLFIDGVLRRGLGRIGLDAVLAPRHGELDKFDRRGRYIKSQDGAVLALEKEHFLFPFQVFTPENDRPV